MKQILVALQLYSVREDAQKDLAGVLKEVARMGYDGVEFAGLYGHDAEDVRKMLEENELLTAGTHTPLDALLNDFDQTVKVNKTLGNRYVVIPSLPEERRNTKEALLETAKLLNDLAAKLEPHGLRLGYHNHAVEFQPVDGVKPWDVLFGNTRDDIVMQLDIGHVLRAGDDPARVLEQYPGRAKTVHIKDFSPTNDKALVGEGNVEWPKVFELCESTAGTEWYIVEQETYPFPPMESVKRCIDNLRELLANR